MSDMSAYARDLVAGQNKQQKRIDELERQQVPAGSNYAILHDQKASGTDGGTATAGSWQTRTINTEVKDSAGIVSLSSNRFTLVAGTYVVIADAPAYKVGEHQIRLQNITDASTEATGSSEYANPGTGDQDQTRAFVFALFTISASKAFEIQHRVGGTRATDGYGVKNSFNTNVYTRVFIIRVGGDAAATASSNTDELVKVSSNDTTPDYLINKIAAGTGIILAELNNGANEDLQISVNTGTLDGLYAQKATLTAKGSIYAASAASTPAELAVGADGSLLVASSGEATGLNWEIPVITSSGAGDSGKLVRLDAAGHIDATMINDADIDHNSVGGIGADDHHASFIGLEDNAATPITPAADDRIQITDDGMINADASGNTLALSIDEAALTLSNIGGSVTNAQLPDPLALQASSILTISTGAVTATKSFHVLAAESGTSDDLDTITAAATRTFLLIQADTGDTITVKHGTGNISLNGAADFSLSGNKTLMLFWNGTSWSDTGAGGGGGGGSITVKEVDGTPSVGSVSTIRVSNGTLTDDGGGQVTISTGGGAATDDSARFVGWRGLV